MASEATLKRVLDLLTKAPESEIESLGVDGVPKARSMRRIIDSKNVVAVGISEKISKRQPTGKLALTFYVEKKVPESKLRANRLIPPTVPEALSGPEAVPTDVVVIGKLRPEVNAIRNPVQPGNSIGHVKITAGTLGALVTRGQQVHILSNSHVLARSGLAKNGDTIIYPGGADDGVAPADTVATLSRFKKFVTGGAFVNRVDCAIAKPTPARRPDLVSEIKGLGVPRGTTKAERGMAVVKVGRTTGKTRGTIRDVNLRFVLDYGDKVGEVGFLDQVLCTRYTKPGDSGSLVLDEKTGKAVGLHFAGANGGSVFCPIGDVLTALGVKLLTKSLGGSQAAKRRGSVGKSAGAKGKRRRVRAKTASKRTKAKAKRASRRYSGTRR
jgi:hypothetical protein